MVAHFTMRTHGVNQAFRFVEGIWLHRESHQMRFFLRKKTFFYIIRAQHEMSNHLILKPWYALIKDKALFREKKIRFVTFCFGPNQMS